jgi:hypothetical protein
MTSDIISIGPKLPPLPPEQQAEFRARSRETVRKLGDALVLGVGVAVDAKTADQDREIASLRARVDRLERLLAPREAEPGE